MIMTSKWFPFVRNFFILCLSLPCLVRADVVPISEDSLPKLLGPGRLVMALFTTNHKDKCPPCSKAEDVFKSIASLYSSSPFLVMGLVNLPKEKSLAQQFTIDVLPKVLFLLETADNWESYNGSIAKEPLSQHLEEWLHRTLLLSKKKQQEMTKLGAKEISMKDLNAHVNNPNTYLVLLLYRSNCRDGCMAYDHVAEIYQHDTDIVFLKINVDKNPSVTAHFNVQRDPTLMWYGKGTVAKWYAADVTVPLLLTFINENTGAGRDQHGELTDTAGRVSVLDNIVQEYIENIMEGTNMNRLLKRIKSLPVDFTQFNVQYYMKLIEEVAYGKVASRLLESEEYQLRKKLREYSLPRTTKDDVIRKLNIVKAFNTFITEAKVNKAKETLQDEADDDETALKNGELGSFGEPILVKPIASSAASSSDNADEIVDEEDIDFHDEL